ncbi:unnamed protein product, partial [Meganyctiphanes norvegica]
KIQLLWRGLSDNMVLRVLVLVAACALLASAAVTSRKTRDDPTTPQPDCDPTTCGAYAGNPECACASTLTPLDDDAEYVPQLVVLSFDDAVNAENYVFYQELIDTYKNPNGFNIAMTYFITHKYNDYSLMYKLWSQKNEIAAHSVSHVPDIPGYWRPAGNDTWFSEIYDTKKMIEKYGRIPEGEVKGWRAPFLETGGDVMFQALQDAGFEYDCSISTFRYSNWYQNAGETAPRGALYPYTMDYKSDLECSVGRCPEKTYPGFWVMPMTDLNDPRPPTVRAPCNMLGSCLGGNETSPDYWTCKDDECKDNLVRWLKDSFHNHYDTNRAPFGLYAHYSWFLLDTISEEGSRNRDAYKEFLDYITTSVDDVWIVSLSTVLEYMKDPQYKEDMEDWMEPYNPPIIPPTSDCPDPTSCFFEDSPFDGNGVYMTICTRPCPQYYPWINNIDGNIPNDMVI